MKIQIHTKGLRANSSMKGWLLLGFIVFAMQFSFAQDFVQSEEEHNLVVMEAENFSSNVPQGADMWVETAEFPGFSGTGAMMAVSASPFTEKDKILASSPVLTYEVDFNESGTHYVWARARRTGGGDDSYHIGLNGELSDSGMFLTFHGKDFANGTFGWINIRHTAAPINLEVPSKGLNEINVYIRESGFSIDKIVLTTSDSSDYRPYDIDTLGPPETLPPSAVRIARSNFNENLFSLSSNLVREELTVFIGQNERQQGKLEILNLQGKVIRSLAINNNSQLNLNISNLQKGMYLVKVELEDNSVMVKKFVKN